MSTRHGSARFKSNTHQTKHDQVPPRLADVTSPELLNMPSWLAGLCQRRGIKRGRNWELSDWAAKLLQRGLTVESVSIQTCLSTTWLAEIKSAIPAIERKTAA